MTEKLVKILEENGFTPYETGCELAYAFKRKAYGYDTKMLVQGSHATDIAEIIYADEEDFKGLCYAPSVMELLMLDYENHGIEKILKKIGKITGVYTELKFVGIYPMITLECGESDFEYVGFRFYLSDMLKAVGMLDYLLQQRLNYLRKKKD